MPTKKIRKGTKMKTANLTFNNQTAVQRAIQIAVLFVLTCGIISLNLPQLITGTIINFLLITTLALFGLSQATFLGMITPLAAAASGVLPLPLLLMLPFITMANLIYVTSFNFLDQFKTSNKYLSVSISAILKSGFLLAVVTLLASYPVTILAGGKPLLVNIPPLLITMMKWPQLITALLGGYLAVSFRK